ncbi:MAG: TetR/AcrR family transcriptional regulator [Azospirillaceae bacterium]
MPPQTGESTRNAILDAAEAVFARHGYDGASLRAIANRAGVNQPLIHYHFESKDGLFRAVFRRRAGAINRQREITLQALRLESGPSAPVLEQVVEALLRPTIELGHDSRRGGRHYAQLVVTMANAPDDRSKSLIAENYNAIARTFIAAFRECLPDLSPADAVWGYLHAISIALTLMAPTGRAGDLTESSDSERADDSDIEAVLERTVPFICAGLRALANRGNAGRAGDTPSPVAEAVAGKRRRA